MVYDDLIMAVGALRERVEQLEEVVGILSRRVERLVREVQDDVVQRKDKPHMLG